MGRAEPRRKLPFCEDSVGWPRRPRFLLALKACILLPEVFNGPQGFQWAAKGEGIDPSLLPCLTLRLKAKGHLPHHLLVLSESHAVPCGAHCLTLAFEASCCFRSPLKGIGLDQLASLDPGMALPGLPHHQGQQRAQSPALVRFFWQLPPAHISSLSQRHSAYCAKKRQPLSTSSDEDALRGSHLAPHSPRVPRIAADWADDSYGQEASWDG